MSILRIYYVGITMLASVYKTHQQNEMYLYIVKKDDFSHVPETLLTLFGAPVFVMQLNLSQRTQLAREDIEQVKSELSEKGYFLQMPPKITAHCSEE